MHCLNFMMSWEYVIYYLLHDMHYIMYQHHYVLYKLYDVLNFFIVFCMICIIYNVSTNICIRLYYINFMMSWEYFIIFRMICIV